MKEKADSPEERRQWHRFTDKNVWVCYGIERLWQVLSVEAGIGYRIPGRQPSGSSLLLVGTVGVFLISV